MHVLHITAWYPNARRRQEALFIRRHVDSLQGHCSNSVWHIECRYGAKLGFLRSGEADRTLVLSVPSRSARVWEVLSTLLVLWMWFSRKRSERYDLINFGVAYPNLVHIKLLKRFIKVPFVITEHFSAYHFSFDSDSQGVDRARRMFHEGTPLIAVSGSLATDIKDFSGAQDIQHEVVPNVVDTEVFRLDSSVQRKAGSLFCVAGWKEPKRPEVLIEALAQLASEGIQFNLRFGGDGRLMKSVRAGIEEHGLQAQVELLGRLDPTVVAQEMQQAQFFVHPSDYETFSVVCAEALCCGTPVIASAVGGIPDFVNERNGSLVPDNEVKTWVKAIKDMLNSEPSSATDISAEASHNFSSAMVGKKYHSALKKHIALPHS